MSPYPPGSSEAFEYEAGFYRGAEEARRSADPAYPRGRARWARANARDARITGWRGLRANYLGLARGLRSVL